MIHLNIIISLFITASLLSTSFSASSIQYSDFSITDLNEDQNSRVSLDKNESSNDKGGKDNSEKGNSGNDNSGKGKEAEEGSESEAGSESEEGTETEEDTESEAGSESEESEQEKGKGTEKEDFEDGKKALEENDDFEEGRKALEKNDDFEEGKKDFKNKESDEAEESDEDVEDEFDEEKVRKDKSEETEESEEEFEEEFEEKVKKEKDESEETESEREIGDEKVRKDKSEEIEESEEEFEEEFDGEKIKKEKGESEDDDSKRDTTQIEAPRLEEDTLQEWVEEFKATKVVDGKEIPIAEQEDLPPLIIAEKEDMEAIRQAIEEQETVQLDVVFPELAEGSDVIERLDLPTYDMPDLPDVTVVVPSVVTTVDPETGQTTSTPPLDKITPGQGIIVPIKRELIADFGGLLQLEIEPADNARAVGETEEWFVVAASDKIPETLPTFEESGIEATPELFIDVSHSFEETGAGFDWTNPDTFAKPVEFEFLIDKPQGTDVKASSSCPDVEIFFLDESQNPPTWTTQGVSIISVKSSSSTSCQIKASSDHLSKFSIGGKITALYIGGTDSSQKGGGCLIATAAFGSELAPQVQMLREVRDSTVMHTQSGTAFMTAFNSVYYSFAPTVADWERENPVFKEIVKAAITPLITTLSILNYVNIDSEAEMLGYGIGVILLNIGMYFVAPIFIVNRLKYKLKK